jgi:hypothetical protein
MVLTLIAFVLPISWRMTVRLLDWPMLLVDRRRIGWLPLNAGNRVVTLLLVNIAGWALSLSILWALGRRVMRERKFS